MTKILKTLPVTADELQTFRNDKLQNLITQAADDLTQRFSKLCKEIDEKLSKGTWVYMEAKEAYYVPQVVGLLPNLAKYSCTTNYGTSNFDVNNVKKLVVADLPADIPTETEVERCFNNELEYFRDGSYITCNNSNCYGLTYKEKGKFNYYDIRNNSHFAYGSGYNTYYWNIPIHRFNGVNSDRVTGARALLFWVAAGLKPDIKFFAVRESRKAYADLEKIYKNHNKLLIVQDNNITLDKQKIFEAVKKGTKFDFLPDSDSLLKATEIEPAENYVTKLKDSLLQCDYRRASLDPYDEKLLLDPNRGHWELWDWGNDIQAAGQVILPEGFTARNPAEDVNNGIVGIDFGTKSTVVVYENEQMQILPLQAGCGNYAGGVQLKNYENPTVLQFIDIESFLQAYKARAGRPFTSWNEVTVSHTAFENLNNSKSDYYYSFFDRIKQWCGSSGFQIKIKDSQGCLKDIPAFMDLVENNQDYFNPLEIYAYYLGLYINNMLQEKHIFLRYIMSYPVTYEHGTREKMRRSFEAGLKKSLPTALLSNEEAMKNFIVQEGASEPAAYAITALEEYGFDPKGKDEYYYAVFDFGGGTTDFDFGVFREAEEDRYDYKLIHFGANGDRTLGGENLLRLLAFEVFKANKEKPEQKIPFTWAAEKQDFPGSEGLIKDSQEGNANMHNLMEALRPIWESPESEEAKKILNSGKIAVNLFTDAGAQCANFSLCIAGNETNSKQENALPKNSNDDKKAGEAKLTSALQAIVKKSNKKSKKAESEAMESDKETVPLQEQDTNGAEENPNYDNQTGEAKLTLNLQTILKNRIEDGVKNFFIAMREAFSFGAGETNYKIKSLSEVGQISIFLAGNSSKSKLVQELFQDYAKDKAKLSDLLDLADSKNVPELKLYPALGTDAAYKLQEEKGVKPRRNDLTAPTGKTGVAFGLLQCRESGNVKVIDITPDDGAKVPFQYYIGRNKKRKFKTIIDRNTKMKQWYEFIDASASFELLYTDVPLAATNNAPVTIAKRFHVTLAPSEIDLDAKVYIRPTDSHTIEYAIARDEESLNKATASTEPKRIELI